MSIIKKLTPARKRFFQELGILSDDDIPKSFFDTIQPYSDNFSEAEKFCIDDYNIAFCLRTSFSLRNVVGTNHNRYANKTWLEAFLDLDRGEELLELYFNNPKYYDTIKEPENCDIGLAFKDGKYYIIDRAGGGNNRMIIMKIKYLVLASKENCDLEKLDSELSFVGNIRISPNEETAKNIFYLMFPNGGYKPSGYQVLNKSVSLDMPLFDIVTNYLINTQTLYKNINEETLANLCGIQNIEEIKKK